MSQQQRVTWAAAVGAIAAALTIGAFVARSVAAAEIAPVDRRVTTLEAQRAEDKERLISIEKKLDRLLNHLAGRRSEREP